MIRKRVISQKREEHSGEGAAEKKVNLGEKLKKVGKRGGLSTPVIPHWRLHHQDQETHSPTARKLAAALWELHSYKLPLCKMQHGVGFPLSRLRRHHPRHHHLYEESTGLDHSDPSPTLPDLPGSACSLRRHVGASFMQHHRSIERTLHAIQPASPASNSTLITPSSSIELKGRIGEAGSSRRTSTELLKVLNRIWSLEEQHASNTKIVRKLKKELDRAHTCIKELLRDRQADRRDVDEIMKQVAEEKLDRKTKERDLIQAALNSARDELEHERKLRKRSESLHRKLALELSEVKTCFANAVKELEREMASRMVLEDLCDEFAWGIRDYEQELHFLRKKYDKEWTERTDNDRPILHISESWLDERMQMKQQPQHIAREGNPKGHKLSSEIEAFLHTKKNGIKGNCNIGDPMNRRGSLESIPLNAAQPDGAEDNSASSDSKSHENEAKDHESKEMVNPDFTIQKSGSYERAKGCSLSNMQIKSLEEMSQDTLASKDGNQVAACRQGKTVEENLVEITTSKKSNRCNITKKGSFEKSKSLVTPGLNSSYSIDDLIRPHNLLSSENEGGLISSGSSNWRSRASPSPVREWTEKLPSHDKAPSTLPLDLKEHTLRAKLLEAKQRGQQSRSRLKGSKISC